MSEILGNAYIYVSRHPNNNGFAYQIVRPPKVFPDVFTHDYSRYESLDAVLQEVRAAGYTKSMLVKFASNVTEPLLDAKDINPNYDRFHLTRVVALMNQLNIEVDSTEKDLITETVIEFLHSLGLRGDKDDATGVEVGGWIQSLLEEACMRHEQVRVGLANAADYAGLMLRLQDLYKACRKCEEGTTKEASVIFVQSGGWMHRSCWRAALDELEAEGPTD